MSKRKRNFKKKSGRTLFKNPTSIFQTINRIAIFIICLFLLLALLKWQWDKPFSPMEDWFTPSGMVSQKQKRAFIEQLAPTAQELEHTYGILPSVILAQAALESNYGHSELARQYYNLFGVKTEASDPNGVNFVTDEYVDGEWIEITDRFKVYSSWEESLRKHSELLYYGTSWDEHFYSDVLEGRNYKAQAKGLQSAGYATDPVYANKIIEVIEYWQLDQYDAK